MWCDYPNWRPDVSLEYAILQDGEIIQVVGCSTRTQAEAIAKQYLRDPFDNVKVTPLDLVPIDVKCRYRYWDERP